MPTFKPETLSLWYCVAPVYPFGLDMLFSVFMTRGSANLELSVAQLKPFGGLCVGHKKKKNKTAFFQEREIGKLH